MTRSATVVPASITRSANVASSLAAASFTPAAAAATTTQTPSRPPTVNITQAAATTTQTPPRPLAVNITQAASTPSSRPPTLNVTPAASTPSSRPPTVTPPPATPMRNQDLFLEFSHVKGCNEYVQSLISAKGYADMTQTNAPLSWRGHHEIIEPNLPTFNKEEIKKRLKNAIKSISQPSPEEVEVFILLFFPFF